MRWPIIGVLASVVGAYYYLRVIKLMWFDDANGEFARRPACCGWSTVSPVCSSLAYVLIGGPIGAAAEVAARTLLLMATDRIGRISLGRLPAHCASATSDRPTRECLIRARAGDPGLLWITADAADSAAAAGAAAPGFPSPAISMPRCC